MHFVFDCINDGHCTKAKGLSAREISAAECAKRYKLINNLTGINHHNNSSCIFACRHLETTPGTEFSHDIIKHTEEKAEENTMYRMIRKTDEKCPNHGFRFKKELKCSAVNLADALKHAHRLSRSRVRPSCFLGPGYRGKWVVRNVQCAP